ncbi:extracellular solute-binding protein [Faecalicatena acetigenes]|uniref:Extracellular solute-binding protein n=1 Tax=Faecalicatena acetigenes TaxID=2981790 RepID=A0ABT2TDS3_9FIRM|nr:MULTISPECIES: extracellular solute-binding protein [Lachnospiraceae]MCU6748440.1 extracellular solute-binding protein [Faecalicatena acetigenes]SCI44422.1 Maltose-binding periplasmic proteins/domains [uncultured Clostridium sp.]
MKKKIVSLSLITTLLAASVLGCASKEGGGNDSDGKYSGVTLNYWSMWNSSEPQGKVIQEAADAFAEETGATINIEWKGRDINTLLSTALSSEEEIDIFEDSYMNIAKNYADYSYDLTDMAKEAGYAEQSFACFNDKVIEWAGFLCAITEQPQVGGVWYNKDIFEDCGISETPATWDEFLEVCQILVDNGYQPLALDSAYADFTYGYHLDRIIGQDVIKDMAINGGWSKQEGVAQAADDIIDFVKKGYLAKGAPDEYPASQNKMGTEQDIAMVVCANYVTSEVATNTGAELKWGMFNYPEVEGGVDPVNAFAGANSIAISSYSENEQAAFDFIMLLTSGKWDQKMADTASQIPADPSNTEPDTLSGSIETLKETTAPLDWNMGMNDNSDLKANFKDTIIKLYEGKFATGQEFAEAMDALY